MPKRGKRTDQKAFVDAAIPPEMLAALLTRLRDLRAAADPADVQAAVGAAGTAVPAATRELGRLRDDPALAALAALLTVPDFAVAAIEALGRIRDEAAVHLLEEVAASPPSKEAGKAARRALHALSSIGMAVAVPRSAESAVYRLPPTEGIAWSGALAGPIGADGGRTLLLGQKRSPTGAVTAIGVLSESAGLLFFQAAPQTHRQLDKEWQVFLDERPETLAQEIPFDYAQALLGEAADHMTQVGRDVPEDYTAWLEFVGGRPAALGVHYVYEQTGFDPASPPSVSAARATALIDEPEIAPWTLPVEGMVPYGAELQTARDSPLILSEEAQRGREHLLAVRACVDLFTPAMRRTYRRRLEETALLFLGSDRAEAAQAALATAVELGDESVSPSDIPFVLALTQRALELATEIAAPTDDEDLDAHGIDR